MLAYRTFLLALGTSLAIPGCVIDDPNIEGLRCPCIAGYVCDVATDRCVREGASSDADVLVDAAIADAPVDADAGPPPTTCERYPDAIFCEDFEGEERVRWTEVSAVDGLVAWDETAARGSGRGLRIEAPSSSTIIRISGSIDTTGMSDVFFHAWVNVRRTSGPIDVFQLTAPGGGTISTGRLVGGEYVVRVADEGTSASDVGRDGAWPTQEWRCVNVQVKRGEPGFVSVLDIGGGMNVTSVPADTDWGAPYDVFSIALGMTDASIDLDDVIWSREKIPCP